MGLMPNGEIKEEGILIKGEGYDLSEISSREGCNHLILDLGFLPECSRSREVNFPEEGSS